MDRYRGGSGDRYGSTPDSHHFSRHSRAPPPLRASNDDHNPTVNYNSNHRRSPTSNYNNRGGFSGGGRDHNQFVSPPRFPPGGGGGFRPVGGDRGGFNSEHRTTLTGQKRGFPFAGRGGSPDHVDGGNYAKLFVGSVPRTATEEEIRPLFEEHGLVLEVALIKDKRTGQQQGCCFIKYATSEEADRAIRALHNQRTLPGGHGPIQVRYADGERERLGALEYKLFVGSLNKQATEQEVEEMFSPYGRVDDVYLMRDEMKHSRGCGFVKFSSRETAMAAITALNGIYTMRGCDQPLTVRFADPKRPRPGESRGGPTFGGPGFGPRFQPPGIRPMPNFGDPMHGRIPPGTWNQINPQNLGPIADSGIHGVGSQFPRPGDMPMTSTAGDGFSGAADGPRPGFQVSSSSTLPQSMPQVPSVGQQISPLQRSNQSPQNFPPSLQLQPPAASSSQSQTPSAALGQLQMPNAAETAFGQAFRLNGQLPASQPQIPQNPSNVNNLPQPYVVSAIGNQQQLPGQQPLMHQSPSQLTAQMLSQQTQALQAKFQSSQHTFSQLQQQLQQMQPSNQSPVVQQQGSQASKQQSSWPGIVSQTGANTQIIAPATDGLPSTPMASVVPGPTQAVALVKCNWTEHTSPDGYKYYYNSTTGESTWQMPEELSSEKQQSQQLLKSSVDQPQSQSNLQGPSVRQVPQNPQIQHQSQFQNLQVQHQSQLQNPQGQHQSQLQNPQGQHPSQLQNPLGQHQSQIQNPQGQHPSQLQNPQGQLQTQFRHLQQLRQAPQASSYQSPGVASPQTNQDLGYTQLTGAASSVHDPTRYQQGPQAAQEWMWKNKPGGGA